MSNKNQPEADRKKGALPGVEPAARNPEPPSSLQQARDNEKAAQKAAAPKQAAKPASTRPLDDGDEELSAADLAKLEADDFEDDSEES